MQPRHYLTLQTQLALPLIPFFIDLFARLILLGGKVEWYLIPDLWTFLVTYAFFCLSLMIAVNPRQLQTDDEANVNVELVRQQLLGYAIFAVAFAGGISFFRAFDQLLPEQQIASQHGIWLLLVVVAYTIYTFWRIWTTHLSYVNRDA